MLLKCAIHWKTKLKTLKSVRKYYTVKKRTKGLGVMSKQVAYELGTAGPTLRGSDNAIDVRYR